MTASDKPQKRNRFSFTVTYPVGLPADHEAARFAGTSWRAYYPTADAADLAQRGFEMSGATVS